MSGNRWKKLHSRKTYRERGQSEDRAHLGLLEKKKDYVARAKDAHRKEAAIDALKSKAAFRNPDEFYHKMIKSRKGEEGRHQKMDEDMEPTLAEKLALQTTDLSYLRMRRTMEGRKVEEMQGRLAMARQIGDEELKKKHTVFVADSNEAEAFDEEEYFDTPAEYIGRAYNRPRRGDVEQKSDDDEEVSQEEEGEDGLMDKEGEWREGEDSDFEYDFGIQTSESMKKRKGEEDDEDQSRTLKKRSSSSRSRRQPQEISSMIVGTDVKSSNRGGKKANGSISTTSSNSMPSSSSHVISKADMKKNRKTEVIGIWRDECEDEEAGGFE